MSGKPLIISKDAGSSGITFTTASATDAHAGTIEGIRSQGTHASPTAAGTDSEMLSIVGKGQYDATPGNYHEAVRLVLKAGTGFSSTSAPGEFLVETSQSSSTTLRKRYEIPIRVFRIFTPALPMLGCEFVGVMPVYICNQIQLCLPVLMSPTGRCFIAAHFMSDFTADATATGCNSR